MSRNVIKTILGGGYTKFSLERNLNECVPYIIVLNGVINEAGIESYNNIFNLKDSSPNWKEAAITLIQFWISNKEGFNEILEMLDKDKEEYKKIKYYMDIDISSKIEKLEQNIQQYKWLAKSL